MFQVFVDGVAQPQKFAEQKEADEAATKLRHEGKTVDVRPIDVIDPNAPQGTPANPAGADQRAKH